jgi:hypothetical protein
MLTADGLPVRVDGSRSGFAYIGSNVTNTPAEQFLAFHPDDINRTSPLDPSDPAIIQSMETGLWCRLAPVPGNENVTGIICDQASPAGATTFNYTGVGLQYEGDDLFGAPAGGFASIGDSSGTGAGAIALVPAPGGCALQGAVEVCYGHGWVHG